MEDKFTPTELGTICPALTNENYEYALSGDVYRERCLCLLNNEPCTGRIVSDDNDQSNQFFSRAKCSISQKGLNNCPLYGASKDIFVDIIESKAKIELATKLKELKNN